MCSTSSGSLAAAVSREIRFVKYVSVEVAQKPLLLQQSELVIGSGSVVICIVSMMHTDCNLENTITCVVIIMST
jgi:hypothetical protein